MSVTPRVKEILSWYEGENAGVKNNLARLMTQGRLAGTGRLVILPVDQGYEHGPARSFAPNPPAYERADDRGLPNDAGILVDAASQAGTRVSGIAVRCYENPADAQGQDPARSGATAWTTRAAPRLERPARARRSGRREGGRRRPGVLSELGHSTRQTRTHSSGGRSAR